MSQKKTFLIFIAISLALLAALVYLIYGFEAKHDSASSHSSILKIIPTINASVNMLSAICAIGAIIFIKKRATKMSSGQLSRESDKLVHKVLMTLALLFSTLFLMGYVYYHYYSGDTKFQGQGIVRPIYFTILISHILLSGLMLPLILSTVWFAIKENFSWHRRIGNLTYPIWIYVSFTGVAVYGFIKVFN